MYTEEWLDECCKWVRIVARKRKGMEKPTEGFEKVKVAGSRREAGRNGDSVAFVCDSG